MNAKVCDRCGKVMTEIDEEADTDSIETDWMEIDAKFLKPDADYCSVCQYKMRAEAGRMYWDNYKQQRQHKTPGVKETEK